MWPHIRSSSVRRRLPLPRDDGNRARLWSRVGRDQEPGYRVDCEGIDDVARCIHRGRGDGPGESAMLGLVVPACRQAHCFPFLSRAASSQLLIRERANSSMAMTTHELWRRRLFSGGAGFAMVDAAPGGAVDASLHAREMGAGGMVEVVGHVTRIRRRRRGGGSAAPPWPMPPIELAILAGIAASARDAVMCHT